MSLLDILEVALPPLAILGGAAISANAAGKASNAQVSAAQAGSEVQERIYNQSREDFAPYRDVGGNALYNLASLLGVEYEGAPGTLSERYETGLSRFTQSPSYTFRRDEGIKALDRSAAAKGKLYSGEHSKDLLNYGQGLASTEYNNYLNRLAGVSGTGQVATGQTAAQGTNYAANVGNLLNQQGAARASGYAGSASAVNSGINNMLYLYGRN